MPVDASLVDRAILTKGTWNRTTDRRSARSTGNCGAAFVRLVTNCIDGNEGFTQRNVHLLIQFFESLCTQLYYCIIIYVKNQSIYKVKTFQANCNLRSSDVLFKLVM